MTRAVDRRHAAGGRPVGFLANETRHMAGAITSEAGDKAARFLQLCDAFGLPVVFLVASTLAAARAHGSPPQGARFVDTW